MGTGSQYDSSNKTGSFASINHKTLLADTGANIEAATKQGPGQLAHCTSNGSSKLQGKYYCTDEENNLWPDVNTQLNYTYKWGKLIPDSNTFANNAEGFLKVATATGTVTVDNTFVSTLGLGNFFTTAASNGSTGGINTGLLYTVRNHNPAIRYHGFVDSSSTNFRYFVGWTSSTAAIGNNDDFLNALSGFGIGKLTTDGNFRVLHNDGSGVTVSDDTGIAADGSLHDIALYADAANNKFWAVIDHTAFGVTTEIPAATTSLSIQALCITTAASARIHGIYDFLITSDR